MVRKKTVDRTMWVEVLETVTAGEKPTVEDRKRFRSWTLPDWDGFDWIDPRTGLLHFSGGAESVAARLVETDEKVGRMRRIAPLDEFVRLLLTVAMREKAKGDPDPAEAARAFAVQRDLALDTKTVVMTGVSGIRWDGPARIFGSSATIGRVGSYFQEKVNEMITGQLGYRAEELSLEMRVGDEPFWLEDLAHQAELRDAGENIDDDLDMWDFPVAVAVVLPVDRDHAVAIGEDAIVRILHAALLLCRREGRRNDSVERWVSVPPQIRTSPPREYLPEPDEVDSSALLLWTPTGTTTGRTHRPEVLNLGPLAVQIDLERLTSGSGPSLIDLVADGAVEPVPTPRGRLARACGAFGDARLAAVALEVLVGQASSDAKDIARTVSQRAAVLAVRGSDGRRTDVAETAELVRVLYRARSIFVHEGVSVQNHHRVAAAYTEASGLVEDCIQGCEELIVAHERRSAGEPLSDAAYLALLDVDVTAAGLDD